MLRTLFLIGLGGGLGSMLRYGLHLWLNRTEQPGFPYGTWTANVLGSLIIGLVLGYLLKHGSHQDLKFLVVVGFCGGFTTFSSFAFENLSLLQSGNVFLALTYMTASVLGCLLAVWIGFYLAQSV